MWLVKKTDRSPPQQLGLMNVVPEKKIVEWASYRHSGFMFDDPFYRTRVTSQYVTYDDLSETMTKLNSRLKSDPLPGNVYHLYTNRLLLNKSPFPFKQEFHQTQ